MQHFKVGKYARKFSAWTPDGLPLAYSKEAPADTGAVDAKDLVIRDRNVKRAFAEEMKRVKQKWEADEAKLTTHLQEVAFMYNQTTAKAKEGVVGKDALRDVLAAYGMKKQRVATAKALNNGDAGDGSPMGPAFARNSTYARENEAKKFAGTSSSLVYASGIAFANCLGRFFKLERLTHARLAISLCCRENLGFTVSERTLALLLMWQTCAKN